MQNKLNYLLNILIMLVISNCNFHSSSSYITDCDSLLKSKNFSFDTSKKIDEYVKDITNQISALNQSDIKKSNYNCTKPEIMRHYLKMHSQIDSVTITPSGHGISFFRKDKNVWSNILID